MEIGRFSPLTYGRDIRVSPHDPKVMYACLSPAARSTDGAIYRSDDVGQTVWLHLVNQLDRLRDPAALAGWLATTTRRECYRLLRASRRIQTAHYAVDAENIADEQTATPEHELLMAERHAALREAFADLPLNCQRLIAILIEDPPVPYAEISATLGIPVGSIGPTRARCLSKLRRHPAVAALINDETASGDDGAGQGAPPWRVPGFCARWIA